MEITYNVPDCIEVIVHNKFFDFSPPNELKKRSS